MSPSEYNDRLLEALRSELWYSGRFDNSVVDAYTDHGNPDSDSYETITVNEPGPQTGVRKCRSMVTGEPAYIALKGNQATLFADKETIYESFRRMGMPDNPERYILGDEVEKEDGRTRIYRAASPDTYSAEYSAWVAEQAGLLDKTECSQSPPTGDGPSLDEVLEQRSEVEPFESFNMQEARACAEKATELVRRATDFDHVHVEWSGPRYDNKFTLWSGNAAYNSVRMDELDPEELAREMLDIIERRDDFGAWPIEAKGSTGEDWFDERG